MKATQVKRGALGAIISDQAVTVLDLFKQDYPSIELETIKVKCIHCGHSWGIRLTDWTSYAEVPERKLHCMTCG